MQHRASLITLESAMPSSRKAFTLIELLVVISILFLLITIAIVAFGGVREAANRTSSLNALRQMGAGFSGYSTDHNGRFMPGYLDETTLDDLDPEDIEVVATLPGGNKLNFNTDACAGGVCDRSSYVWRLTPYLSNQWQTMFVDYKSPSLNERLDREFLGDAYGPASAGAGEFGISEIPSYGMNTIFIGGDSRHGGPIVTDRNPWSPTNPDDVMAATRLSEVKNPARILLFGATMRNPAVAGPNSTDFNVDLGSPTLLPPYLEFDNNGQGMGDQQWEFGSTVETKNIIIPSAGADYANGGGWPVSRTRGDLVPIVHLDGSTIAENRFRLGADGSLWAPDVTTPARIQDSNN